jgi:hypothetical protein
MELSGCCCLFIGKDRNGTALILDIVNYLTISIPRRNIMLESLKKTIVQTSGHCRVYNVRKIGRSEEAI